MNKNRNVYPKEDQAPKEPAFPSLYWQIKEAAGPEGLPEGFSLQKAGETGDQGLRFVDGGVDGVTMYHTSIKPGDLEQLQKVLYLAAGENTRAGQVLEQYFRKGSDLGGPTMLSRIDGLQSWIIDHKDELPPQPLFRFARKLLQESRNPECVKFALAILELLDTSDDKVRELITTLALSDEFTLFCSYVIRGWEDGGQVLFRLAKQVHGWGRVFLVAVLEGNSPEVREWLLWEGWKNSILPSYSARRCAAGGGLLELLQRERLSDQEFEGIRGLVEALLDEGPVRNISAMEEGKELLREYLRHASARGLEEEAAREKLAELE